MPFVGLRQWWNERRAVTQWGPMGRVPGPADGFGAHAGVPVTEHTALQLLTVYACVRILADQIASLPLDVFRRQDGVRSEVSPTPRLIREPQHGTTNFEWIYQLVTSLALRGDGFAIVTERDFLEFATQAVPVHPDDVEIEPLNGGQRDPVGRRWRYRVGGEIVPGEDVIHISRFRLAGHPRGLSPINAARQGISLGLAAEKFGAQWFGDGAAPSSQLVTEQSRTPEQVQQIQQEWLATQGGRRLPAVLSGGFEWKPISITPEESQFLETRKFQRGEIAMMYGVPPHMIGDTERSTSWGTGIEQQTIGFDVFTLRPWLVCFEQALTMQMRRGQFVKFNVDALLRADIKSRYEAYERARNAGWMNVDEIRELEDMPPIPGGAGQNYLQPLNMGPLGIDPREKPEEGGNDA